jgi:hypothetical protein
MVLGLVVVFCLALFVDIALRVQQSKRDSFAARFTAVPLFTNGTSGILIRDRVKNEPLWGIWNFDVGDSVNCFVNGRLVLSVTSAKGGRSETEVLFYGEDEKLITHWKARENGVFYGRTFFDEAGAKSEAWLDNRWHPVVMRTNEGKPQTGIVVEGKWQHIILTNGILSIEN